MKYLEVAEQFRKKEIKIFSPLTFQQIAGFSREAARSFLQRYKKKGLLINPRRGFYYFTERPPHDYELANTLYTPSYVSFETVLSEAGIIPEVIYSIISATTKPTRRFGFGEKTFKYLKIKKQAFIGYSKKEDYFVADPEKALADYLYFVALGKKRQNDRLDFSQLRLPLVRKYAAIFENKALDNLVQKL